MEEAKKLVQEETRNCMISLSLVMFSLAKKAGVDVKNKEALLEYLKNVQEQYIREKNEREKHSQIERCHSYREKEIPTKNVTDFQDVACLTDHNWNIDFEDDSEYEFEGEIKEPMIEIKVKDPELYKKTSLISFEMIPPADESNIKCIENVVSLCDEIEIKSSVSPTLLHRVSFGEAEPTLLSVSKAACPIRNDHLTEESGYDSIGNASEAKSAGAKPTCSTVMNDVPQPVNVNTNRKRSLLSILHRIKYELNGNTTEVFQKWEGSEIESMFNIVGEYLQKSVESKEPIHRFIINILKDIWNGVEINKHPKWSEQLRLVKNLFVTPSLCQEVLNFIAEVLDYAIKAIKEGSYNVFITIKVSLFLRLFEKTVDILKVLIKMDNRAKPDLRKDVTKLWQKNFLPGISEDHDQELVQDIKTNITPKLTNFVIITMHREPAISVLAKDALEKLKGLHDEIEMSQVSLMDN